MKSTFLHGHVIAIIAAGLLFTTLFAPYAGGHEILVWGSQKTPNAPLTNLTKIAAGMSHNLALKSDGSIVGWGSNISGEATPPAGNDFRAVAAGSGFSLALKFVCQYTLAGDLNNDCKVNLSDLAIVAANWLVDCQTNLSDPACVPK
jgi:hypothetical protein